MEQAHVFEAPVAQQPPHAERRANVLVPVNDHGVAGVDPHLTQPFAPAANSRVGGEGLLPGLGVEPHSLGNVASAILLTAANIEDVNRFGPEQILGLHQ